MSDKKITGELFCSMVTEGALAIAEKKEQVNELNVFPVPDGDTGTNMSLTMASAMEAVAKLSAPTLGKAAETTASALLRGARGNSGVILSLLFRGVAKRLHDLNEADGCDFALALREGVEAAYKAVMKPAEGTILTVSRVAAQFAVEQCQAEADLPAEKVFEAVLERGKTALEETVHQNPVLEKAGVVDAGGFGLLTIWEGMFDALRGIHKERQTAAPTKAAADFGAISEQDITFTYCTEFIAERRDKARNVGRMRSILSELGDSLVVVEDEEIVKVHVHTDQPNKALEEGLKFGPLLTVKIENMREQHTAKVIEGTADAPKERVIVPPEKKYGFVAIAAGDGLKAVFSDLGVDVVVQGGQTMNPSTDDIIHAVDAVPAEIVFVLPNNKNIIMAAEQAVHLAEGKKIVVVPTKTIPQGISAMLAVDTEGEEGAIVAAMQEAAHHVHSGQVTYAARDSEFDGKRIKQGEYLSLCEGKLCASGKESSVVKKLVRELVEESSAFATVIYGEGVSEEAAMEVEALLRKENKGLEISVINGGQPVYYYILSVE
ncbi:DAK2 domain-containing protein [Butyricicoccus faecihominis]|uniref:DAK2 domain-containing protein n=1 Tax=Butyricicoccus faecihominis TaxID=1712515 RepID=UPI002479506D|nr:DAK2 domain-containing protein [Butyricicoccus faecihominis]MCQ5129273.1 DAK2 domain-containing protein [Butyricicoccus faecihominis]